MKEIGTYVEIVNTLQNDAFRTGITHIEKLERYFVAINKISPEIYMDENEVQEYLKIKNNIVGHQR
jgi:hypothetical protein